MIRTYVLLSCPCRQVLVCCSTNMYACFAPVIVYVLLHVVRRICFSGRLVDAHKVGHPTYVASECLVVLLSHNARGDVWVTLVLARVCCPHSLVLTTLILTSPRAQSCSNLVHCFHVNCCLSPTHLHLFIACFSRTLNSHHSHQATHFQHSVNAC